MSHYRCECIYKPLGKIHLLCYLRPVYDWKKNPSALQTPQSFPESQSPSLYGYVIFAFKYLFIRSDAA